jgi:hypothetical protein
MYAIKNFQCEPHRQHQNPAKHRSQEVTKLGNHLMDHTNTPPKLWLLCLLYVIYLLNRLSIQRNEWKTPIKAAFGQKPDVSASSLSVGLIRLLPINWNLSIGNQERTGCMVCIAGHQGDSITFLVLTTSPNKFSLDMK